MEVYHSSGQLYHRDVVATSMSCFNFCIQSYKNTRTVSKNRNNDQNGDSISINTLNIAWKSLGMKVFGREMKKDPLAGVVSPPFARMRWKAVNWQGRYESDVPRNDLESSPPPWNMRPCGARRRVCASEGLRHLIYSQTPLSTWVSWHDWRRG